MSGITYKKRETKTKKTWIIFREQDLPLRARLMEFVSKAEHKIAITAVLRAALQEYLDNKDSEKTPLGDQLSEMLLTIRHEISLAVLREEEVVANQDAVMKLLEDTCALLT